MDLSQIRTQLDEIDTQLITLFERRMYLCGEVAQFKLETNKPVFDKEREDQKLAAAQSMAGTEFNKQAVKELFTQLMTISRRYQYQLLQKSDSASPLPFTPVDELPLANARIVYQGVEGAYSHAAALQYFGEDADVFHVKTWEEAMTAVENREADYAVIPIENSSAGAVSDNYDQLILHHNVIAAETMVTVNHALLGLPGAKEEEIKTVYSHPQALMQCSQFLGSHREWRQISVENTALAARKITRDGDPTQAAVASETAGRLYNLSVLHPAINHHKNNTTRFLILTGEQIYRRDAGKISLCFELPHKSGSLYNMLGNFIYNGVNMLMIESRPIPGKTWEYRFFVDIEGNLSEASVKNALRSISEEASAMWILGNY